MLQVEHTVYYFLGFPLNSMVTFLWEICNILFHCTLWLICCSQNKTNNNKDNVQFADNSHSNQSSLTINCKWLRGGWNPLEPISCSRRNMRWPDLFRSAAFITKILFLLWAVNDKFESPKVLCAQCLWDSRRTRQSPARSSVGPQIHLINIMSCSSNILDCWVIYITINNVYTYVYDSN